ncbi:hypothetical protein FQR65_LT01257 [Abscondita terminalis]|nr:hypothetical protein FQR65_LT01257 [Abscondita terminalis]
MGILRKIQTRKIFLLFILVVFSFAILVTIKKDIDLKDQKLELNKLDSLLKDHANYEFCKQPHLPVDTPEIMKFVKYVPPIDCSGAGVDWVVCKNSECRIQQKAKSIFGKIECTFTDLIRSDDFHSRNGESVTTDGYYKLEKSDVVRVNCKSENGKKWSQTMTSIRDSKEIRKRADWSFVPEDSLKLNVLMFGFDSISRNTFIRKLPKSYKYLIEVLKGDVLKGYNIVGDGTPQALIPILTGKTELELPDTRKRISNSTYVNVYPFVWNDFRKNGYVTGFLEDVPNLGTFTYRLRGFKEEPTDHYMRPYYVAAQREWTHSPKLCTGAVPRHNIMLNHIKSFFNVYKAKPKFIFGFHGELSHDSYNLVGAADDDLLQFLKDINHDGVLEDTLLILMADHGPRFADVRNTIQGKLEERLPFFSFTFPKSFKIKYSNAYANFLSNVNKLTTPFDIHATLMSILHLDSSDNVDLQQRSLSLFSKIPVERSCGHAQIEPHWCSCLEWTNVSLTDSIVEKLGNTLVNTLNDYTSSHRNLCATLSLSKIFWVTKMRPNEKLLKFHKNADIDGFVPDLSSKMKVKSDIYQLKAMLLPGESLFEASITHFFETNDFHLNISDVSRINMYGKQARCIENDLPHLRKYCYCKD